MYFCMTATWVPLHQTKSMLDSERSRTHKAHTLNAGKKRDTVWRGGRHSMRGEQRHVCGKLTPDTTPCIQPRDHSQSYTEVRPRKNIARQIQSGHYLRGLSNGTWKAEQVSGWRETPDRCDPDPIDLIRISAQNRRIEGQLLLKNLIVLKTFELASATLQLDRNYFDGYSVLEIHLTRWVESTREIGRHLRT